MLRGRGRAYCRKNTRSTQQDSKQVSRSGVLSALFEVTLVAVLAPGAAIFSCVLITSLRWAPTFGRAHPNFSPKLFVLALSILGVAAGNAWFGRLFNKYRTMPDACASFDTEQDQRIVFWQKWIVLLGCGAVIPVLAMLWTFGTV